MKKTLLATLIATQLFTQLHASEEINHEEKESPFYVIVKGMMVLGDTVHEEFSVLDGDRDYGYAIDFGYRLGNGLALEYDFSYAKNTVTDTVGAVVSKATGKYYTSALDVVYSVEATEKVALFGKVGYEYEWETIDEYKVDNRNHDFVFGVGAEVAINEEYKFVGEYEHSLVKGPHGDSLFAGLLFNF